MSDLDNAQQRVALFLEQRSTMGGLDPDYITACNHAVLRVSDLRTLLRATSH